MPTKTARASDSTGLGAPFMMPANVLSAWTELPRRQMALMTHSATALLRGSQEMRRIQQECARRAMERHEQTAERLREPCEFNDLVALQSELVRFNMQEAANYWAQLANAMFRIEADMVSSAGEAVMEGASEPTLESLQRAFEATLDGAGVTAATTAH
jgi:hypothetical protein